MNLKLILKMLANGKGLLIIGALLVGSAIHADTSSNFFVWARGAGDQIEGWNTIQNQASQSCRGWQNYNFINPRWRSDRSQGGDCWWAGYQDYDVNLGNFFNPNPRNSNPGAWVQPRITYRLSCYVEVYCSR